MRTMTIALFSLTLMFTIAAADSIAETITVNSSNVVYKVNELGVNAYSGDKDTFPNTPANKLAVSTISGNAFYLKTTAGDYQDAGILLYFSGGLTLRQLQNLTVTSTGAPLDIALWLDTGNDGTFLEAKDGKIPEGPENHDRDSRVGKQSFGNTLNSGSTLDMREYDGNSASGSINFGDLQNGLLSAFPKIGPDTLVAIWIGINNEDGCKTEAWITKIEFNNVPEPSLTLLLGIGLGAAGLLSWRKK
jgi:hypothetical protein